VLAVVLVGNYERPLLARDVPKPAENARLFERLPQYGLLPAVQGAGVDAPGVDEEVLLPRGLALIRKQLLGQLERIRLRFLG
jgi:hypothetical protein